MDAELTGRNVKVTGELRRLADEGLARIEKFVGTGASAHVILGSQKRIQIAEVTVNARHQTVVGLAEAPDLAIALRTALDKAQKQAMRRKKSIIEKKRQAKPVGTAMPAAEGKGLRRPNRRNQAKPASPNGKFSGLHIVPAPESMAKRPMTLEEAVKEAESSHQPVFVFRDLLGDVKVLHCTGDGLVRLIEVSAD